MHMHCSIYISQMSMLFHAAQARKHTRARTGCTCPVFIEAPVFQQERAAAHHQCHHQFSRSRSTHAAPKPAALNVNPTLQAPVLRCNPQTGTSAPCCRTLRPWMRICQDNIFATAHLACVGCTARFMADLFASVRDLTCHHAPHAFLCDYAHGPLLLNGGVGAAERDRPSRRDGTVPGAATVVIPSRFPCPRCAHCCLPCVGLHLGVSTQSTSTKAASRLPWRIQKTLPFGFC